MIKLILSDVDGTLLPYGQRALDPALFQLIHALHQQGILFCPASGRQYHSLHGLFAPVAEELYFLCENGAVIYGPGPEQSAPVLSKIVMPQEDCLALAADMLRLDRRITLSGVNTQYTVAGCGEAFLFRMRDLLGYHVTVVDDPTDITEDILKVSIHCPGGTEEPQAILGPRWSRAYRMAAAGPDWVDFTLADKGLGLRNLCAALQIDRSEVMAFGDNWNDASMLEEAGIPYLMADADPALRGQFPNHCSNVLDVLSALAGGTWNGAKP